eukprot:g17586.t2
MLACSVIVDRSGTFGGVLGDKENAGSEARAAAAAAAAPATGKLAQEIAHHLKGATPSPGASGKPHQHQHGLLRKTSVFFAATTADSMNSPKAATTAAGPVLPLSPSSTATRFSNTNFDRYGGGGGREGMSPYCRTVGFAHAPAPAPAPAPSAAALRLPASRPKKTAASRREVQERRGCGVDADVEEVLPSPTSEFKTPVKVALSDAAAKSETTPIMPGGIPKRSRSPVAGLTLLPPARCDDEVSSELEAKARRRSAAHNCSSTATRAAVSGVDLFSSRSAGASVFDTRGSGSCDGRWRKLHARGGGASGPPRLKLSVETAGDNDEVLLSPSGHQAGEHHRDRDPPARYYCSSPLCLSSAMRIGGRLARDRDNVLTSSVDSEWSMGSIDETTARELANTREEDKTSGSDPVARMLLSQSDDWGINSTAPAAATTTAAEGGGRGKDADAVSSAGDDDSASTPAIGVADVDVNVDAPSPHRFEVGGAGGGGAAASVFRSTAAAKGSSLEAPLTSGLFSLGSRGAGLLDASVAPRTRLFKPVAFRLP